MQGFREPFAWDRGQTDSPVANLSTIRSAVMSDEVCKVTGKIKRLSSADVSKAFLKSDEFDDGDPVCFTSSGCEDICFNEVANS